MENRYLIFFDAREYVDQIPKKFKENLENLIIACIAPKDLQDAEAIIESTKLLSKSSFIFLIDDKTDICYVYKATGTIAEIKKDTLPWVGKSYESLMGMPMFLEKITDLRALSRYVGYDKTILN